MFMHLLFSSIWLISVSTDFVCCLHLLCLCCCAADIWLSLTADVCRYGMHLATPLTLPRSLSSGHFLVSMMTLRVLTGPRIHGEIMELGQEPYYNNPLLLGYWLSLAALCPRLLIQTYYTFNITHLIKIWGGGGDTCLWIATLAPRHLIVQRTYMEEFIRIN